MDAFEVHRRLIRDYRQFTEGFVDVHDKRIREVVDQQSASGAQWPAPWLSLNPSFASGGRVDELVAAGRLHAECARIFRDKSGQNDPGTTPITLHRHQSEAVEVAATRESYVLTTGTGSGKSLSYIVPIVDRVLREGSGKGIKAIVVYPMNALANSQMEELGKFLSFGYSTPPVTFARYTGQEPGDERGRILAKLPDILLTNYVMLELMLTRPEERARLAARAKGLQFLVLDELHTYRGRQGADVAMLVRRVRDTCQAYDTLQCVGTSATMSSGGTLAEQAVQVAEVASRIFGTAVRPEHVITETLVRATTNRDPTPADLATAVRSRGHAEDDDPALHAGYDALRNDALASWIEDTFGITEEPDSGRLIRRPPTTVDDAARLVAGASTQPAGACANAIRATLLAGSQAKDRAGRPLFAFRLHQFLSKGGSVYLTAEPVGRRAVETTYQVELPGGRRLFPTAFCRECGQDYLLADRVDTDHGVRFRARMGLRPTKKTHGYLFLSDDREWPADPVAEGRLPGSWRQPDSAGHSVIKARRGDVPVRYRVTPDGVAEVETGAGDPGDSRAVAAWIPGVFRFCLRCGVSYEQVRSNEFGKLVTLDVEGRSSAMTVVAGSILRALRAVPDGELRRDARKLLTFVDNRQDASLQAGHFNDFTLVAQLRAAVHQAALAATRAGDDGLDPLDIGAYVTPLLGLDRADYDAAPGSFDDRGAKRALRHVVEYRVLRDLQRGWRVTLPNLEQTGLVVVDYPALPHIAAADELWRGLGPLRDVENSMRVEAMRVLLDELRRVLAIDAEQLTPDFLDRLRGESRSFLTGLWALSETEPDPQVGLAVPGTSPAGRVPREAVFLSGRGTFGRWLRHHQGFHHDVSTTDAGDLIAWLMRLLAEQGVLVEARDGAYRGFRIRASSMLLRPGDGTFGATDPVRRQYAAEQRPRVVAFFRDLYRETGKELAGLHSAEHTAQVRAEDRQVRERLFRGERDKDVKLPLLFCSPTLELGVDIASLNAVGMRNVPPTPANYAQRSGRAGRSGEPAIVVTYCASGNSHDTYYFERSHLMVAGRVQPPRLDLANEDLVRSHLHAIWLAETGASLASSMRDVLVLDEKGYPVRPDLRRILDDRDAAERAQKVAGRLLEPLVPELERSLWWGDGGWSDDVLAGAYAHFERSCDRWRELYASTTAERDAAYQAVADVSSRKTERDEAERRLSEARHRIDLLLNDTGEDYQSDFYTYRYFASEGFLPGYSFPRLPLAAYIPGSRGRNNAWLQRPRFLAVREFGPGALIYHEGARYQVSRINLPRSADGNAGGHVVLGEARVCESCGYHHPRQAGLDVCESCGATLPDAWKNLLHMQSVITRRRERITSDEEERNRVGFELRTTYRFVPRRGLPGHVDAEVLDAQGDPVAAIAYGDGAQLRITNLGRVARRNQQIHGYWLDLVKGRWLSEAEGNAAEGNATVGDDDDDLEAGFADVKRKEQVTPYVEDRRNILVVRWAEEVSQVQARTAQYALERGIEALFQLEDSELDSELLPDAERRGRFLLQESAEGGAGVLRRLQAEPDALARVATEALRIIHVDPQSLDEDNGACVRGCYRCLLSYGNQGYHEQIDRREVIELLHRMTSSTTRTSIALTDAAGGTAVPAAGLSVPDADGAVAEFLHYLRQHGLRQPSETNTTIEGLPVDLVYRDTHSVVILDAEPDDDLLPLIFSGWNVVRIVPGQSIEAAVATNPSVFGMVAA